MSETVPTDEELVRLLQDALGSYPPERLRTLLRQVRDRTEKYYLELLSKHSEKLEKDTRAKTLREAIPLACLYCKSGAPLENEDQHRLISMYPPDLLVDCRSTELRRAAEEAERG
jgi:hypothetical protein